MSWRQAWGDAATRLGSPAEARWLVEEVAGPSASGWLAVLDAPAPPEDLAHLDRLVRRREAGEPLAYVLGHWSFRSLELLVGPGALVPRPETEQVAEVALAELGRLARSGPGGRQARLPVAVDLGTGSGALALALAAEGRPAVIWAVERSADALAWARANLRARPELEGRVHLVEGSWYGALPADLSGTVDLVVSNPPYVSDAELAELPPEVRHWEPVEALLSAEAGLAASRQVLEGALPWLSSQGAVVMEVAAARARETATLARQAGFAEARVGEDLAGRPRVLLARVGVPG